MRTAVAEARTDETPGETTPSKVVHLESKPRVCNGLSLPSARVAEIADCFGVVTGREQVVLPDFNLPLHPGRIIAFVGPSGAGKTTALRSIEDQCPTAHNVERMGFPEGYALVDTVVPKGSLAEALEILSLCALGEAPLWLQCYGELSAGEQFRARLARAIGSAADRGDGGLLIIDEFGDGLHRRAAKAIAFNLRKLVTRRGLTAVLATSLDDVVGDLQPDILVELGGGQCRVTERVPRHKPLSLWRRLHIAPGRKRDYDAFARMHYRGTDELGFVDKVFVLSEGMRGRPVGVVVYGHPPATLALRNQATGGRFKSDLRRLNREVRILRRLVIDPDLRGCGVGHRFVRRTLPMAGTRYVECLAAMGAVNPVFERAGMRRIGTCEPPPRREEVLEQLKLLGVNPFSSEFERQVCLRPAVRALVAEEVGRWYQATTACRKDRAARQSPALLARLFRGVVGSAPVYYLWERGKTRSDRDQSSQIASL